MPPALGAIVCLSHSFGSTSNRALEILEEAGGRLIRPGADDDFVGIVSGADAIISGTETLDAALLANAPRLRVIAKHGTGVDNIDLDEATRLGIAVVNAAGANATAVAELVLALMLGLARNLPHQDARVRQGQWGVHVGQALEGATLGIVGLGRIGQLVAARAAAFEMRVIGFDVAPPGSDEEPWERVELDQLLREADVVTLHVPFTPATEDLIDAEALRSMRPSAYLINTSRGGVVDERALDQALAEGWIAGAALDVFTDEPLSTEHPLAARTECTILTPHMGAYTGRALARTSEMTSESVVSALRGTLPVMTLNEPDPWRGA